MTGDAQDLRLRAIKNQDLTPVSPRADAIISRMRLVRHAALICLLAAPAAAGADILSQLGITLDAAKEAIASVITAGIYNPGLPAQAFKLMPPAARAQAATAGVAWLKTYVASPDFTRQYQQARANHKPEARTYDMTPEQELQKADEDQKQQLEDSKKAIAALPAEQRKAQEEALKSAADLAATMNTPESRKMRLDAIRAERAEHAREYDAAVVKWKQEYPGDPKPSSRGGQRVHAAQCRRRLQRDAGEDAGQSVDVREPAYQAKPRSGRCASAQDAKPPPPRGPPCRRG